MSNVNKDVAGMFTMYNSDNEVIERIGTYINQVTILFIVDNSEVPDNILLSKIKSLYTNVCYINNGGNKGIASALNAAALAAVDNNFSYLLMMDDDSEASDSLVRELVSVAAGANVGIVSPQSDAADTSSGVAEVLTTITSGSILKLNAYVHVGPFMNELFIDWVDHEYCFRLQKYGYKVMLANDVKLKHRLGVKKTRLFAGSVRVSWRSHNPTRLYYKVRNSLFVLGLYKRQLPLKFILYAGKELIEDFLKIIFLENEKARYLKLVVRAFVDLSQGRFGKLRQL